MSKSLGAFELEMAIEPSQIPPGTKISNIELSGENLFIGTDEGLIIQFKLRDRKSNSEASANIGRIKELGPKSPVTFLRSASALDRLLVLCDATLYVINASDLSPLNLSGSPKFKGVTACCVNENPNTDDPFSVQVCLGKKRQLAVINITEERVSVEKIREMPASVQLVCMDGHFVCAALETHYIVYNVASGQCQDLFPIEPDSNPVMIRIAKEEFLLSAPGGLGMFVTSAGMSERPPIQWTKPVLRFAYCHPYIIALTESRDNVVVYSILDQKAKQTLQFFGGCTLGNFDGQLIVSSTNSVYRIRPVSVQLQIEYLLENERVEEALELAENAISQSSTDPGLESSLARARVRSAFISLKRFDLHRARELLVRGRADPREVICLYPRLLPASSNFTRSVRALNDIADVNQVAKNDVSKLSALDTFLIDYLEYIRASEGDNFVHKHDVDTALIKMYAKVDPSKLVIYLRNEDILCDVDDCFKHLEKCGQYHALGLLHQRQGHHDEALAIWADILKGEKSDPIFPGIDFFITSLHFAPIDAVWRYADFVLGKSEKRGVEMFMRRHEELVVDREERIVNFLQPYKNAYLIYLEYLVTERQSKVEFHHTQLAVTYLDSIGIEECPDRKKELRRKFQAFVLTSELIRPKYLLSRLEGMHGDDDLSQEKATIYGKLGDHDKALRIFVHKMKDFRAAEDYCDQISVSNVRKKQKLLQNLLEVFLDPQLEKCERDELMIPALDLVSRRAHDMNGADALEILPDFWSLCALYPALQTLLRSSSHKQRMGRVMSALCQAENVNVKLNHLRLARTPVFLQETSYCVLCQKPFKNCEFARYPNGVVIHIECIKDKNICPITGQIFTVQMQQNNSQG